jgi:hypothetical protein
VILGLSGLAGVGKSMTADFLATSHSFTVVALADPLKRIAKDIFDFSDQQLYGASSERNAPDRRYYRLPLSPEEIRKRMAERHSSGADDVRPMHEVIGLTLEQYGCWAESQGYLTARHALQQLGTEYGRGCYENIWVHYALRRIRQLFDDDRWDYTAKDGLFWTKAEDIDPFAEKRRGIAIPDVRFRGEVDAIKKAGGRLIRIMREGAGLCGSAAQHVSEQEQLSIPDSAFDAVLENNGTKDDLFVQVVRLLPAWL